MEFNRILLDIDASVATLRLNHPEVLNAISPELLAGFGEALDAVEAPENGVRCLVLTGVGRAFCAGANLQSRREGDGAKAPPAGATLETQYHPLLRRLRGLHCPIITAVNGIAAGAGMSFALMGDMVLAAQSAYFLQAFRRIGLVPDCGSTWLLPRRIGTARAIELSLLGEKLPAATALEWGLVNRVVDDAALGDAAAGLARNLADGPTVALSMIRELYWQSPENSFEDQLALECRSQRVAGRTADFKEGVQAFLEKRPARFRGA
ncbi:MAG: enoyl-CoA hydratase/isomerase [Burkholderiales bacterium]|nr:enoyl-CoA hydratase/isomerase [Burkholderiales bacterium]